MATWEDILGSSTRTTGTRGTPTRPAVMRRSDVMQGRPVSVSGGYEATPTQVSKKPKQDQGGFMGLLQDILESPVGKVVGKAGEIISIPGRVIPSAMEEIANALDNDPNTVASWGDFAKQIADPTFGFGTVVGDVFDKDTWWGTALNRSIGLIGDIVLDPLTYVTFGANKALAGADEASKAIRVSSRQGREALAERILEKTGNVELAKDAFRYGRSVVAKAGDDVIQQIGMDRAGVYFMGRRIGGTKIAEAAETGLSKMRVWSGDHILKKAAESFTPTDVRQARIALARGQVPTERAEKYLRLVMSENQKRAIVASAARDSNAALKSMVDEIGEAEFRSAAPTVHRILEGTVPMVDEASGVALTAEQRTAQKIASWFKTRWDEVDVALKEIDPAHEAFPIKNYFPHVLSDDGMRFVTRGNGSISREIRESLLNTLSDAPAFNHRLTYGQKFFGKELKEEMGPLTVDNLNKIAKAAGFKGDFFETNAAIVMQKYVNQHAEQMGQIARRGYLVQHNVFPKIAEEILFDKKTINSASKTLERALKEGAERSTASGKKVSALLETVRKNAAVRAQRASNDLTRVEDLTAGALGKAQVSAIDAHAASQVLDDAISEMQEFSNSLSALYDEVPDIIRSLEDEYDSVISQMSSARAALESSEMTVEKLQLELEQISVRSQEIAQRRVDIAEAGQYVQENIDKIVKGSTFSGEGFAKDLANALSSAFKQDFSVKGTREASIRSVLSTDWWKAANPTSDITVDTLKNLNAEQVANLASAALRGEAQINEMRKAILWVASANPNLRTTQPQLWDNLFGPDGVMIKAAQADQYHQMLTKTRAAERGFTRINSRYSNFAAGESLVRSTISQYVASRRMLNEIFGEPGSLGISEKLFRQDPMGALREMLTKPEYEVLAPYFDGILDPFSGDTLTYIPSNLDFDDVVKVIKGIGADFESGKEIRFAVSYETTGKIGAEKIEKSFAVNVSDMVDDVDWLIANGTREDIDNFVDLVISGNRKTGVVNETQRRLGGPKVNRGGRIVNPAERIADDTGKGGRRRLEARLNEAERLADAREAAAETALLSGDVQAASIEMVKRQADLFDAKAIRETMKELISRDVAENSIRGQMRKLERELKTQFPDIPTSYLGTYLAKGARPVGGTTNVARVIYEDAMSDLQAGLSRMWFANDVESRVAKLTEVFAAQGLVPDLEIVRRVYNKVAKEHLQVIGRQASAARDGVYEMQKVMTKISLGQYTDPADAYKAIDELLSNTDVSRAVARARGAADAPRLREKWLTNGGASGRSLLFDEAKAADGPAAQAAREAYIEELRDWYQAVYPGAKRRTPLRQIKEALDVHTNASLSSRKRVDGQWVTSDPFGPSSTLDDLHSWLRSTIADVSRGSKYSRQSERWLKRAADPYIDVYSVPTAITGSGTWGMNLPSVLADSLYAQAKKMLADSETAAVLRGRSREAVGKAAAVEGEADALELLRQVLETPSGVRPRKPLTQAAREGVSVDDLREAQKIVRQIVELKQNPNYFAALERQELNDVLNVIADIGVEGNVRIPIFANHITTARNMFDSGVPIYIKRNGEWLPVTSRGQISDTLAFGDVGQRASTSNVGGQVRSASDKIKNKSLLNKVNKRIDKLERELADGVITQKKYEQQMRKLMKDIEKVSVGPKDSLRGDIVPVANESIALRKDPGRIASLERQQRKLQKELDSISIGTSLSEEDALRARAEIDAKLTKVTDELIRLRAVRPGGDKPSRFVTHNGNEIVFTPEEIEALFLSGADAARASRMVEENTPYATYLLELERDRASGRLGQATRRMLEEARSLATDDEIELLLRLTQSPRALVVGGQLPEAAIRAVQKRLAPMWDKKIAELSRYRNRMDLLVRASNPEVQNAALMKAHYILQAIKRGEFSMDELVEGVSRVESKAVGTAADARRAHLKGVWEQSNDYAVLSKIEELESRAQYAAYSSVVKDGEKARNIANKLRIEAGRIQQRAYGASWEEVASSGKFYTTLQDITDRLANGYDAVVKYHEYTTRRSGRLSPEKAIERIKSDIAGFKPSEYGPFVDTGTALFKASDSAAMTDELTRLANEAQYLARQLEPNVDLVTGKITPGLELSLRRRGVAAMEDRAKNMGEVLESQKKAWAKEKAKKVKAGESQSKKLAKNVKKAEKNWIDATAKFDEDRLLAMDAREYAQQMFPKLDAERTKYVDFLSNVEQMIARGQESEDFVSDVMNWLDEWDSFVDDVVSNVNPEDLELIHRLRSDALGLQNEILQSNNSSYLARLRDGLENGDLGRKIKIEADKGFKRLTEYGMPSYQAEEWLADMLKNMSRMESPEFARGLGKFLGRYTGFFKAYAVSTPGFVVRNALGNTFMLVAGGASLKNMDEGMRLFSAWHKAVKAGTEKAWMSSLDPAIAEKVAVAVRAMDASGYGRGTEALRLFNPKRKWLVDNKYVNTFRKSNEWFEGSARFTLAWDTVQKGGDFSFATARVKRFLFDYSTSTPADDLMRSIVPFWFWMSRNLPMQIINQYENPRAYIMYQNVMSAVGQDDSGDVVPSWLKESGAVKIGDNLYLNPDLGFNRVGEQLSQLADPKRLLSYVNPGLRVPAEAWLADKKFYNDVPFSERGREAAGGPLAPAVQALASVLGQGKTTPTGDAGVTDRFNYMLTNLLPPLAQISRVAPSDTYNKERRRSNWASYFGIPVREVTESMIQSELRRRAREGG